MQNHLGLASSVKHREEISDAGPELVAERAGLDIIHASMSNVEHGRQRTNKTPASFTNVRHYSCK